MRNHVHEELEKKMEITINILKDELHSIRVGRANPLLLDHVKVDYYGVPTPIKQLANISVPEPRSMIIQPYDPSIMAEIEKAILTSDLGLNPSNDGKIIRLTFPIPSEERRKSLSKHVKKVGEESKVALRNERRNANELLKKMEKNNELTEDGLKLSETEVQKMTDDNIKIIDEIIKQKEKDIMEI